jgi:hypothetical protein
MRILANLRGVSVLKFDHVLWQHGKVDACFLNTVGVYVVYQSFLSKRGASDEQRSVSHQLNNLIECL